MSPSIDAECDALLDRHRFLGDIVDKRFRLLRSMSPFHGLSVSLSVTFVHCARMVEHIDESFCKTAASYLCQIVLKFSLHRSTPSSPNFAPK